MGRNSLASTSSMAVSVRVDECFSQLAAPLAAEIQLPAGYDQSLEATKHVLTIAAPTLFQREVDDPSAYEDTVILGHDFSLDHPPDFDRDAGREEIGYVVKSDAHPADLPVDHREIIVPTISEEHVVQPEVAVAESQRAGGSGVRVLHQSGPVSLR